MRDYVTSLPDDVRALYDECLSLLIELRGELSLLRDAFFHYLPVWRGRDRLIEPALGELADDLTTLKTGTVRTARLPGIRERRAGRLIRWRARPMRPRHRLGPARSRA